MIKNRFTMLIMKNNTQQHTSTALRSLSFGEVPNNAVVEIETKSQITDDLSDLQRRVSTITTDKQLYEYLLISIDDYTFQNVINIICHLIKLKCIKYFPNSKYSKKYIWYYLNDNLWIRLESMTQFYDKTIISTYSEILKTYTIKTQTYFKIYTLLKNVRKDKGDIIFALSQYVRDKSFFRVLDRKPDHINFNNGIYDIKTKIIRKLESTDYVSKCISYDFSLEHSEHYSELIAFLNDLFPETLKLAYMMSVLSSIFDLQDLLIVFVGSHVARAYFKELLSNTFGDYFSAVLRTITINRNALTPSMTSSKILFIDKERIRYLSEDKLNKLVHHEKIKFSYSGIEFESTPLFTIILSCSTEPLITKSSIGRKSHIIRFDSPDKSYKTTDFKKFAPDFMSLLLQFNHKYRNLF